MLFVCQRVTNAYKGMDYLIEACRQLADAHPTMKDEVSVVLLGSHADEVASQLPFPAIAVGVVIAAVIVSVITYGARMVFG